MPNSVREESHGARDTTTCKIDKGPKYRGGARQNSLNETLLLVEGASTMPTIAPEVAWSPLAALPSPAGSAIGNLAPPLAILVVNV